MLLGRGEERAAAGRMALVHVLLGHGGERAWEHLRRLHASHRAGHLDRDAAVALLERAREEVRPVRREPGLLVRVRVEAERLGVLADVGQRRDRLPVAADRLHHGHRDVVDVRI